MKLQDLLKYDEIVIQCHDNPDADALASGYGVYTYLQEHGKNARLIYAGNNPIQKANLVMMTMALEIPVEHVESLDKPQLLVTVDCQYGEDNVRHFDAYNTAIIDHHQLAVEIPEKPVALEEDLVKDMQANQPIRLSEIRSNLGSCSTLVWDMLKKEGVDVNANKNLATALYYGLLTDTNNFTEISHPLDKDLRDEAIFEKSLITKFINTNLSLDELVIAGKALIDYKYNEEYRFAIVQAEPCDPNILGVISDLVLEVDVVDTCVVYSILPRGIKLSVRSCVKEVKACELVQVVTEGIGSGGGHLVKAGGFIKKSRLNMAPDKISDYINNRLIHYFECTEIITAAEYDVDISEMEVYRKNSLTLGYVKATDMYPVGTNINVRTLEGDLDVTVEDDIYIIIGICGEVYPIHEEKLLRSYTISNDKFIFEGEYEPTIRDFIEGTPRSIIPYAKYCVATGGVEIYAKKIDHRVKIFTAWDTEKYMLGRPNDYLAVRKDDLHDVYIIDGVIFGDIYSKVEK